MVRRHRHATTSLSWALRRVTEVEDAATGACTLKDVGKPLGVSGASTQQIEIDALAMAEHGLSVGDRRPAPTPGRTRYISERGCATFACTASRSPPKNMSQFRHLSVWVDESEPGRFHWVLHESISRVWIDIESSEGTYTSWLDAFDAGNGALMKLVHDERLGPRALGEDQDAAPMG